jgi:putative transcription factor
MSEMQCEICGAEIPGTPNRIVIDRSTLDVCKSCARFGKAEDKWTPVPRKVVPIERAFTVRRPQHRDQFKDLVEILPEYGRVIREARERLGITPDELASTIKEKATLIKKIERQELVPEDRVRKKLEKELDIKLTDQATEEKVKYRGGAKGLTLGDIADIKRK